MNQPLGLIYRYEVSSSTNGENRLLRIERNTSYPGKPERPTISRTSATVAIGVGIGMIKNKRARDLPLVRMSHYLC